MTDYFARRAIINDVLEAQRENRSNRRLVWFGRVGNILLAAALGLWLASWTMVSTARLCVEDPVWCERVSK